MVRTRRHQLRQVAADSDIAEAVTLWRGRTRR
jgi:hypothetical protein